MNMSSNEFKLFLDELWSRIEDLRVGSKLTDEDVILAIEIIYNRLSKRNKKKAAE